MDIKSAIQHLIDGHDLEAETMHAVMHSIMSGECTPPQIAGFLVALRIKGETVTEITAAAKVMRELAIRVPINTRNLIDTCGTGGDGANTFNISTTSAFVVAGAGMHVAKHGNRSVSSRSGSADVLEAAGVKLDLTPEQVGRCIEETGIGFMFAPLYHGAMKHAIGPRRELGVRTIFNLLGPLTNPAAAPNQVIGVFSDHWLEKLAEVLHRLGSKHVMIVHAEDGLDEISISSPTCIAELMNGEITTRTVTPEQFGIDRNDIDQLSVSSVKDSLERMISVLENRPGPATDIVLLNAGAAIYIAGGSDDLSGGIERAREVIVSGAAKSRLDELVSFTNAL